MHGRKLLRSSSSRFHLADKSVTSAGKWNECVDGERHAHGRWQVDNAWVGDGRLCGDGVSRFDIAFGCAEFNVHFTFDDAHGVCRPCLCRDRMCAYTMVRLPRPRALQLDDHYVRTRNDRHATDTRSYEVSFRVCKNDQKPLVRMYLHSAWIDEVEKISRHGFEFGVRGRRQ
jgi:hypothetical protein